MNNIKNLKSDIKKGFTLVETMVSIFILSFALVGIIGMIAKSSFASIYAKNEIIATYLLQEAVDYIRNDKDTSIILNGMTWENFVNRYDLCGGSDGCYIKFNDVFNYNSFYSPVVSCSTSPDDTFGSIKCPILNYNKEEDTFGYYYNYNEIAINNVPSNFKRKVFVSNDNNPDQLDIVVEVEWKNGNLVRSRILKTSLLNWIK